MDELDLPVNPYDYLGVRRGCRDLKEITRAYHKKSRHLHPDRKQSLGGDFSLLNKCYIYLKTIAQELEGTGEAYSADLEERMQMLKRQTGDEYEEYRQTSSQYNNNRPALTRDLPNFPPNTTSSSNRPAIPNFEQPVIDNSMISGEDFNHDAILREMMEHRPASTSYRGICGDAPSRIQFTRDKFNLNQFNEHFERNMQYQQEPDIAGFTGFDELDGAASIVSDGRFMFVQNVQRGGDNSDTTCAFGLLKEHGEYYDRNLERERMSTVGDGSVSEQDLRKFTNIYNASGETDKKKLNVREFQDRLKYLEAQKHEQMLDQRMKSRTVIDAQMQRLSEGTRVALESRLRLEGGKIL